MSTVAENFPFRDLCMFCEKVANQRGKDKKRKILSQLISEWRNRHKELHKDDKNTTDSFFPAMRLLLPQCERERAAYGMKEHFLAKILIKVQCLSEESEDSQKLLNYRAPKSAKDVAGDFASVAEFVFRKRCPPETSPSINLEEINKHFDDISINNVAKNKEEIKKTFRFLTHNISSRDLKWLIRMILKEMKLGISEQTVLNTFHPDAKELFDVTSSLAKVCDRLKEPSLRLHEIEISLFSPFRPMLAERADPSQVVKMMQHETFYIETKYDGERIQLHKNQNVYKYFSRSGNEYTKNFGSCPLEGTITPYICNSFKNSVKNCILDGEMVGYNTRLKCIGSKAENFDVKNLGPDNDYQPCLCVFDILLYNNKVLSNLSLRERLEYLKDVFEPVEGCIMHATREEASTEQECVQALNNAIDQREEGIVVKNPASIYRPSARKGGWMKVKPEYVPDLMNDLDLVILGGYFGEGRRRGIISHFLLGLAVPGSCKEGKPQVFHSFTKVGSGYSICELYELVNKLNNHWQVYDKKNPPVSIVLASGHKEKPDLWVEPSKSYIVQVKATEIIKSDRFKTGCTLRFPRVEKVRYDKPWFQCMTLSELEDLKQQAQGKLAFQHLVGNESGETEPSPKKRRVPQRTDRICTIAPQFQPADVSGVKPVSAIFSGKQMCVVIGLPEHSKQNLEKLIVEYGGSVVQNPDVDTFCVITSKVNLRVKNIISMNRYDVVRAEWLLRCVEEKQFIPWTPFDLWSMREATQEQIAERYDSYGDSYTEETTVENLRKVFDNIPEEIWKSHIPDPKSIADLEFDIFPAVSSYGLFRTFRIYIDNKAEIGEMGTVIPDHPLELVALKLRLHGGTICSSVDSETTHVVVHNSDTGRVARFKEVNRERTSGGKFHLVTEEWVEGSIQKNRILTEKHFFP
ncbi:DNA ligase 4-like isoform X1 [Limulus polyphemus]|uniref:DNA ligase n=2 Tax=Limulus polyphemus TaxID=6850 RepID=A0ABM1B7W0_LIMPO|nr:DNA ligase 4-like isoform X1 [Limulus polyphemus]